MLSKLARSCNVTAFRGQQKRNFAKVVCVLYDDPKGGYPSSYARDDVPKITSYPDQFGNPGINKLVDFDSLPLFATTLSILS